MAAVSKILSSHPGPARRLDIHMFSTNYKAQAKFNEWFLYAALDELEELNLKLDDVTLYHRPRSASRQRCAAAASAPAIFPRLMLCPPFFSLNSRSPTSSTLSS